MPKEYQRRADRKYKLVHAEKLKERERARYYSVSSPKKDITTKWNKAIRLNNPWRKQAYDHLARAIKQEIVKRRPCKICGELKVIAKFGSYFVPYEIVWLCHRHHKEIKKK